jgi:PEP-CTERM motif
MKLKALAPALFAVVALPSYAALVQFGAVADLSSCDGNSGVCNVFTAMPVQTIGVGDTVDFTVSFAGNQRLQLTDVNGGNESFFGWLDGVGGTSNFSIANASITFDDLQGSWSDPFSVAAQSSGSAHLGPAFFGDLLGTGSSVSFSAYRVQFTVTALSTDPNTYSNVWFLSDGMRVDLVNGVPEPATLGLAGLALALAGAMSRRRKA